MGCKHGRIPLFYSPFLIIRTFYPRRTKQTQGKMWGKSSTAENTGVIF